MQKLFTLFIAVLFSSPFMCAQDIHTLTANVIRTKHNIAIADDIVTPGEFYFKNSGEMRMSFHEGKEQLVMDGGSFIMIDNEKSSVAKGKDASHLGLLQNVLQNIISGGDGMIDASEVADMEITKQDNTISITPIKANRRAMFTSFSLTVDPATSLLKSMCMHERGGNYTQYDFSGYVINGDK